MKIRIGDIFRVPSPQRRNHLIPEDVSSYLSLTRGEHEKGADTNKGIFGFKEIKDREGTTRRSAIILHSNSFKKDTEHTPWVDIIDTDNGYAIYHGDNKSSESSAAEARGNKLLLEMLPYYSDPRLRIEAPPIILFSQIDYNGLKRGYRQFSGYGIITGTSIRTQKEKGSQNYFTNIEYEIALFGLEHEDGYFNWEWIDKRRDSRVTSIETLEYAPEAWRIWVEQGNLALERVRRKVFKHLITRKEEQVNYYSDDEGLLNEIILHYERKRHSFEGLASLIAQKVIGGRYNRGWITRRSGDGGVDFVSRLELGSDFSSVSIVILGQAKCNSLNNGISGHDLARVVARLRRGWIGVFVTTSFFTQSAQAELFQDEYPLVLINGKRLALEVRKILNHEGITLQELLDRETTWYENNLKFLEPHRILEV